MLRLRQKRPILNLREDLLTLSIGFTLIAFLFRNYRLSKAEWIIVLGLIFLWQFSHFCLRIYNSYRSDQFIPKAYNFLQVDAALGIMSCLFFCLFPGHKYHSGMLALVAGFPIMGISISMLGTKIKDRMKHTKGHVKYTLVAGVGKVAKNVEKELYTHHVSGYEIKGFIHCLKNEECVVGRDMVVGELKDIHQVLKTNPVDEIVIALPGNPYKKIQNILSAADYHGIRVKYIPDYGDIFGRNYKFTRYGQIDAVNIRQLPLDGKVASLAKNSFDKAFSAFALLFLAPLFLILAVWIKLDSPGPVFYCPMRVGKGGRAFKLYKFRSMRQNDDPSGGKLSTQANDQRITKLGRILRKYSLDELPQFLNVFLGDMSVVGPRPHRSFLNQQLQESIYKYMVRHYVKPGITGWAQVNGWRGPTDTEEQKKQRTLHDLWYIENWSLWLDIKIIFLTVLSKKAHNNAF